MSNDFYSTSGSSWYSDTTVTSGNCGVAQPTTTVYSYATGSSGWTNIDSNRVYSPYEPLAIEVNMDFKYGGFWIDPKPRPKPKVKIVGKENQLGWDF